MLNRVLQPFQALSCSHSSSTVARPASPLASSTPQPQRDAAADAAEMAALQARVAELNEQLAKAKADLAEVRARVSTLEADPTTWPGKYTVSRNVLVMDGQNSRLECLGTMDEITCTPATLEESTVASPPLLVSSEDSSQQPSSFQEEDDNPGRTIRKLSLNTEQRLAHPHLAPAQRIINFLRLHVANNLESLEAVPEEYAQMLIEVCEKAAVVFAMDPTFLSLRSPAYIMGDIHGSASDLSFFMGNLLNFDHLCYTPSQWLFLGDYVDRGVAGCEVAAMLFAVKCVAPDSVFLLRGNHELAEVNRNTAQYRGGSFLAQCRQRFGYPLGDKVNRAFNAVFAQLPVAAEINGKIFCCHAGIPRPLRGSDYRAMVELLRSNTLPRVEWWADYPLKTDEDKQWSLLISSLLWSDPAPEGLELDSEGYGPNESRGSRTHCFGQPALERFFEQTGYEFLIRAHEVQQNGLRLCLNGKVITVFSSSGYCGGVNGSGALYLNRGKIRLISCTTGIRGRSKYHNQDTATTTTTAAAAATTTTTEAATAAPTPSTSA
eukprot:RCo026845